MADYYVIFTGKLEPGFERAQVIANISKLVKLDSKTVEGRLFSGKPTVIKKLADPGKAKKFLAAFKKAGAVVVIKKVEKNKKPSAPAPPGDGKKAAVSPPPVKSESPERRSDPRPPAPKPGPIHQTAKNRSTKKATALKVAGALVLVVLIAAGAGLAWVKLVLLDMKVPEKVEKAEQALAMEGLIMLAHVNVGKIAKIQEAYLKLQAGDELADPTGVGLNDELMKAGISIHDLVEQALAGFYKDDQGSGWMSFALFGSFPVEKVRAFVMRRYDGEEITVDRSRYITFKERDIKTCEYGPVRAISISPDRIVISDPDHINEVTGRLDSNASASVDLGRLKEYRSSRLFSLALFKPQDSDKIATGVAGMMLSGAKSKMDPVSSLFAGGSVELLPPSLEVDLALNSDQQAWVDKTSQEWITAVAKNRGKMAKMVPSSASLFNSLVIEPNPGWLKARFRLDKNLIDNARTVFGDILGELLSFTPSPGKRGGGPVKDEIDRYAKKYVSRFSLNNLTNFNFSSGMGNEPLWTGGPFAIDVERVALNDDGLVEITLSAQGLDLVNNTSDAPAVMLYVTKALDGEGKDVLRKEPCGRVRNDEGAPFSEGFESVTYVNNKPVKYSKSSANKTIRLARGVRVDDLKTLHGRISMNLPTKVETVTLKVPLENLSLDRDGVRIKFKPIGKSSVEYTVSGDKSRLLEVRALNKEKKPLQSGGGMSMDSFFGSGKFVSKEYRGEVRFVEVILVAEKKSRDYLFTLSRLFHDTGREYVVETEPVKLSSGKKFRARFGRSKSMSPVADDDFLKDSAAEFHSGPVNLGVYNLSAGKFFGASFTVSVRTPIIPVVENNHSSVELVISGLKNGAGEETSLDYVNYIDLKRHYLSKKEKSKRYMTGKANISLDYKQDSVSHIKGEIRIRIPKALSSLDLTSLSLGSQASDDLISVKVVELKGDGVKLLVEGDRGRIIRFRVYNADGKEITASESLDLDPEKSRWVANISYLGHAMRIETVYAKLQDVVKYPFSMPVSSR